MKAASDAAAAAQSLAARAANFGRIGRAYQLLSEHTAEFSASNNIDADLPHQRCRQDRRHNVASIRAGKEVAPEALPDVALIRRRDFGPALASEYLQSLETLFSSSLLNDLDSMGVEFGQIPLEAVSRCTACPTFSICCSASLHSRRQA